MEKLSQFINGLIITICGICFVSFMSMIISLNYQKPKPSIDPFSVYTPRRYTISKYFDVPPKVASSGFTWASALASFFESYFRKEGISLGIINETQYVKFSEQKLKEALSTQGLEFINEYGSAEFPASLFLEQFAYGNFKLSDYFAFDSKPNEPLKMDIKTINRASTVQGIKDLVFQSKRPLLLSFKPLIARYSYPCDTQECFTTRHICPPSITDSKYCGNITTSTLLANGYFFTPIEPAEAVLSKYYWNVVLEGFNDDSVVSYGINSFSSQKRSKGGFIVRGFSGPSLGSMITRYEGNVDPAYLDYICQNPYYPASWYSFNASLPTTQYQMNTVLKCIDETSQYCINGHRYILLQDSSSLLGEASVTENEYGITYTAVADITEAQESKGEAQISWINRVQFWQLGSIFEPEEIVLDPTLSEACGHWLIPYDYIDTLLSINTTSVFANDFHIKFASENYKSKSLPLETTYGQRSEKVGL